MACNECAKGQREQVAKRPRGLGEFVKCVLPLELGPNFDGSSVLQKLPNLFNFLIRNSYAAVSPIMLTVCGAEVTVAIRQTVNEDVSSGRDAKSMGSLPVGRVRVSKR